jgi:hypothetical protein
MLAMAFLYSVFMNQQQYAGYQEPLTLYVDAKKEIEELTETREILEQSACEDTTIE